ncbi:MAG: discoidin domain-containing protein, partial [Bacteroidaceae bacterium]|nr:discoidin domain-containing protein [Bacteroidaceae bacterium]
KESCTIKVKGFGPRGETRTFGETFTFNKATAKPIEMLQPINEQYKFEGATTLVDGLKGNNNYRTGRWLGFRANDFEAVIDLKAAEEIKNVSFNTNVEKGDWIFGARGITISVSEDGKEYTEVFNEAYPAMTEANPNQLYTHSIDFAPVKARYVKVKALVEHSIPEWHGGRGNYGFLFVDEIAIN